MINYVADAAADDDDKSITMTVMRISAALTQCILPSRLPPESQAYFCYVCTKRFCLSPCIFTTSPLPVLCHSYPMPHPPLSPDLFPPLLQSICPRLSYHQLSGAPDFGVGRVMGAGNVVRVVHHRRILFFNTQGQEFARFFWPARVGRARQASGWRSRQLAGGGGGGGGVTGVLPDHFKECMPFCVEWSLTVLVVRQI